MFSGFIVFIALSAGVRGYLFDDAANMTVNDEITWKIVGGSSAANAQFPFIASLRAKYSNSHFCGGSIINANWIVTAAHCMAGGVDPYNMAVVVGTNTLNYGGEAYDVQNIMVHPYYTPNDHKNDIALIQVNSPIQFSERVQPIPIGGVQSEMESTCVLSGWGSTALGSQVPNFLQFLHLRTVPNCYQYLPEVDDSSQICTFLQYGQGACHGDSGGPLTADGYLVGVVSYGTPCAKGYPDVFTRVTYFQDWINSNMY